MDEFRMWLGFIMMAVGGIGFIALFLKAVWDYFTVKPPEGDMTAAAATPIADLLTKLDQRYIAAASLVFLGYMLFDPAGFPGFTGGGGNEGSGN